MDLSGHIHGPSDLHAGTDPPEETEWAPWVSLDSAENVKLTCPTGNWILPVADSFTDWAVSASTSYAGRDILEAGPMNSLWSLSTFLFKNRSKIIKYAMLCFHIREPYLKGLNTYCASNVFMEFSVAYVVWWLWSADTLRGKIYLF
jgi:hypothetical protein